MAGEVTLSEAAAECEQVARIGLAWVSANSEGFVDPTADPRLLATIAHARAASMLASSLRLADLTNRLEDRLHGLEDEVERFRVAIEERPVR